ncbi:hypothetical protein ES708_16951 [subsurface metagenome]|jgi:hypothetical protein
MPKWSSPSTCTGDFLSGATCHSRRDGKSRSSPCQLAPVRSHQQALGSAIPPVPNDGKGPSDHPRPGLPGRLFHAVFGVQEEVRLALARRSREPDGDLFSLDSSGHLGLWLAILSRLPDHRSIYAARPFVRRERVQVCRQGEGDGRSGV